MTLMMHLSKFQGKKINIVGGDSYTNHSDEMLYTHISTINLLKKTWKSRQIPLK